MNDGSLNLTIDNLTGPRVVALSPDVQNLAVGLQFKYPTHPSFGWDHNKNIDWSQGLGAKSGILAER